MKLLSKIITVIATGSLLLSAEKSNASGMLELMAGNKSATSDIKVFQPIGDKASIFFRNRTSYDYESEKVTPFTLTDLNYNIKGGLDLTFETQFLPNGEVSPRLGFEHFKKFRKDITLYTLGTVNVDDSPKNFEGVFCIRYTPQITKNTRLLSQVEGLFNFGEQSDGIGHNFTALRV